MNSERIAHWTGAVGLSKASLAARRLRGTIARGGLALWCWALASLWLPASGQAQVPALLNYQGRVQVGGANFTGAGQFKFALVSADGTQVYWLNSPDLNADGQPDSSVAVTVASGLFYLFLGDTNQAGMAPLPATIFTNASLRLRLWFNNGTNGFQQLTPDQIVAAAPYAAEAANVVDGSITTAKLATNTVTSLTAGVSSRVDALTAQLTVVSNQVAALVSQANATPQSGMTAASADPQDAALLNLGFQWYATLPAPGWFMSGAANPPDAVQAVASAWTGQQLLVWGGNLGGGVDSGVGAGYQPNLDAWQPVNGLNAPAAREQAVSVWSGQELLVWGGLGGGNYLISGGRYNPSNQVWSAISTNGAPTGRVGAVAAWTGSRFLVWGGRNANGVLNDGAFYNPTNDQWTALTLTNAPSARSGATAVVAGNRLLIWGGQADQSGQGGLSTGSQLLLNTNGVPSAWVTMSVTNAPAARYSHSAVWTGQKMIVWGGLSGGFFLTYLADGAAYDPILNTWAAIAATNGPSARSAHAATWSGSEMLIFGGAGTSGTLSDGAAYNPVTGKWRVLSNTGNPLATSSPVSAWTGTAWLLFGGAAGGAGVPALQSLNPQPTWYLYRKP